MHAVILAGGEGKRLWPISKADRPKFFLKFEDKISLLQKTFLRANSLKTVKNIITITGENYINQIKLDYSELYSSQKPCRNEFLVEPSPKDTAAAILASAMFVEKKYGPDETILILPTDHLIANQVGFAEAVVKGRKAASRGKIVTFGITPTYGEVNYGYIETQNNKFKRFVEKPTKNLAEEYFLSGKFLWNSGILCSVVKVLLTEMKYYCPDLFKKVEQAFSSFVNHNSANKEETFLDKHFWESIENISVDYALMEKSKKIAVIPCDIDWNDIGNWNSIGKLKATDMNGNNINGNALTYNVSNCYIESRGKMIAAVGVKNLAIIETENGLLIVDRQNVADVKEIFSMIKEKARL